MRFKSPSLPELHAFLAVCQLGSFRQAADVLCVTQVAVSRAVQRLEQRLECTLLDRSGSRVKPTLRGAEFQQLVESHVAGLETAIGRFGVRSARQKVRVSVVPTLCTRWLVPRLGHFKSLHPDVEVELRQFHHEEAFESDDVDLWIRVKRSGRPWPRGISARYLFGREMVPACAPELAGQLRHPRDLLKATLLHHISHPGNWALWLQAARVDAVPELGPGFDLGNNLIVGACAGMGVTVIQPLLIEPELASGQLVLPYGPAAVATDRGYYLCSRSALARNDSIEKFTAWLNDEAKSVAHRCKLTVLNPSA